MKIKAIVANESFVHMISLEGDSITFTGSKLISTEELFKMSQNITLHGFTEIISKNKTFHSMFEAWVKSLGMGNVKLDELSAQAETSVEEDTADTLEGTGLDKCIKRLKAQYPDDPEKVQAIVDFIARSDLAVTATGNLLAYRRVVETYLGELVDNHTRSIPQNLHSIVCMPRESVDSNGHVGCSRGLHVASSEYVKSFTGNVLQLVLVEPENIISVPYMDRTKMRVCEYAIVYQFNDTQASAFYAKGSDAIEKIIAHFTAGNIPKLTNKVFINESGKLEFTDIDNKAVTGTSNKKKAVVKSGKKKTLDVKQVKQSVKLIPLLSLFESATNFADKKSRYQDLLAYKRKQKQSWEKLGVSPELVKVLNEFAGKV